MKKTLALLLLLLAAAASCVSCGGETGQPVSDDDTGKTDTETMEAGTTENEAPIKAAHSAGYTAVFDNGMTVTLGGNAAEVFPALGDYTDYMEAPSCIHDGYDKVYTFAGAFTVTTSPDADGGEYVAEISLLTDAVALQTENGSVMIGSDKDAVAAAFGEPSSAQFGTETYPITGGSAVVVLDDDNCVTGLTLLYSDET